MLWAMTFNRTRPASGQQADVPDQSGRVAIVTGANTGIGYHTAAVLAYRGAHVVLAVRNLEKGNAALARIVAASPQARRHAAGARPELAGLGAHRRRRAAVGLPAHRPADQQRRRDVDPEAGHQGRLRNAVRHQPSRSFRADRVAARPPAAGARVAGGDRQQHGPPDARRDPLRRPAVGAQLRPGRRLRAIQAGQPAVHLRTAAPAEAQPDRKSTIAVAAHPGGSQHRADPQPAGDHPGRSQTCWGRSCSKARRWAPCRRCGPPPIRPSQGGQYYGPDGFGEQRGHPKVVKSSAQSHDEDLQRRLWTVSEELTGVTFPV